MTDSDKVQTRDELVAFLRGLLSELEEASKRPSEPSYADNPDGWANLTLWGFLESMTACLEQPRDWPDEDPLVWNAFAKALYLGKIYE